MDIVQKIKDLPKQELIAYAAIGVGAILIIIALLLW